MSATDVSHLLGEAAKVGAYFVVDLQEPYEPTDSDEPPVPSLAELYAGHPGLGTFIRETSEALRADENRVGGSILFQGLAARLWSPVVAAVLLLGRVPVLPPAATWWSPRWSGGRLVSSPERLSSATASAEEIAAAVTDLHLAPLVGAVRTHVQLPEALLWGNAASALVGSAAEVARARPDLEQAAAALVEAVLADGRLAGAGTLRSWSGRPPAPFVRASCCLYYRVPGGGWCGDCPLLPDSAR